VRRRVLLFAAGLLCFAEPAHAELLYLNFSDGMETIFHAELDDAPKNQSSIGGAAPFPAFSWPSLVDGSNTRTELARLVARRVHEIFLPYNVLVTTARPAAGPYTMVIIGGGPADLGFDTRVGGLAYLDCGNVQPSNVVFAFPAALRGSLHGLVVTIAQEAAHAFGLEHTTNPRDIMHPRLDPAQAEFPDQESPIFGEHHCGSAVQNSHRRLLDIVGPWVGDEKTGDEKPFDLGGREDKTPPRLLLLEPLSGSIVRQPFVVRVSAEDDVGIDRVVLAVGDERHAQRRPPFAWSLAAFPEGPLTLAVTGYDESGNAAFASTQVIVENGGEKVPGGCAVGPRPVAATSPVVLVLAALLRLTLACTGRRRRL
jgi:hypothetical protein